MGLGKIVGKVVGYVSKSSKTAANAGRNILTAAPAPKQTSSVWSRIETNTPGRVLRMQEAKEAFTPYATKVSRESTPTLQKIEEITGVARGNVKDATGYFNKQRAADALAAFKYEPIKPNAKYVGRAYTQSTPTQQAIDEMLGIADTPQARLSLLRRRAEIRETFNGIKPDLAFLNKYNKYNKAIDTSAFKKLAKYDLGKFKAPTEFKDLSKINKKFIS